jgi:hypothetical protein
MSCMWQLPTRPLCRASCILLVHLSRITYKQCSSPTMPSSAPYRVAQSLVPLAQPGGDDKHLSSSRTRGSTWSRKKKGQLQRAPIKKDVVDVAGFPRDAASGEMCWLPARVACIRLGSFSRELLPIRAASNNSRFRKGCTMAVYSARVR